MEGGVGMCEAISQVAAALAEAHDPLSVLLFFSPALAVLHPGATRDATDAAGCQELMQLRTQLIYTQYGYTVYN
jgi:hypothetical protein